MLESSGKRPPKALKTGTTICGVVYNVSLQFQLARRQGRAQSFRRNAGERLEPQHIFLRREESSLVLIHEQQKEAL